MSLLSKEDREKEKKVLLKVLSSEMDLAESTEGSFGKWSLMSEAQRFPENLVLPPTSCESSLKILRHSYSCWQIGS
jgi:hypothetical protein